MDNIRDALLETARSAGMEIEHISPVAKLPNVLDWHSEMHGLVVRTIPHRQTVLNRQLGDFARTLEACDKEHPLYGFQLMHGMAIGVDRYAITLCRNQWIRQPITVAPTTNTNKRKDKITMATIDRAITALSAYLKTPEGQEELVHSDEELVDTELDCEGSDGSGTFTELSFWTRSSEHPYRGHYTAVFYDGWERVEITNFNDQGCRACTNEAQDEQRDYEHAIRLA